MCVCVCVCVCVRENVAVCTSESRLVSLRGGKHSHGESFLQRQVSIRGGTLGM